MKELRVRIQHRINKAEVWNSINPILEEGEIGIVEETGAFKVGNGRHTWNVLDYASSDGVKSTVFNGYDNEKTGSESEKVGDLSDSDKVFRISRYKAEDHPGEIIVVPRSYTITEGSGKEQTTENFIMDTPYISLRKNNKWIWVVFSDQKDKALVSSQLGSFVLGTSVLN